MPFQLQQTIFINMPHDYNFLYILQNGNIKQQNETTACKYKTKVTKQINWKKALTMYMIWPWNEH